MMRALGFGLLLLVFGCTDDGRRCTASHEVAIMIPTMDMDGELDWDWDEIEVCDAWTCLEGMPCAVTTTTVRPDYAVTLNPEAP